MSVFADIQAALIEWRDARDIVWGGPQDENQRIDEIVMPTLAEQERLNEAAKALLALARKLPQAVA